MLYFIKGLVIGTVICLSLFSLVRLLLQSFVLHLARNRGWLILINAADGLDSATIMQVQEHLQNGPGHGADFIPDDDRRMKFWPMWSCVQSLWPFHRKKLWYVYALTPIARMFLVWRWVRFNMRISHPEKLDSTRGFPLPRHHSDSSGGAGLWGHHDWCSLYGHWFDIAVVLWFGEVWDVFLRHVQLLALAAPLGQANLR